MKPQVNVFFPTIPSAIFALFLPKTWLSNHLLPVPASLGRNWEDADPAEGRRSRLVKDFFTLLDPDNKQLLRPIGPSLGGCGGR